EFRRVLFRSWRHDLYELRLGFEKVQGWLELRATFPGSFQFSEPALHNALDQLLLDLREQSGSLRNGALPAAEPVEHRERNVHLDFQDSLTGKRGNAENAEIGRAHV